MSFTWVDNVPDDYRCSICLEPWADPRETPCEHVYCAACLASVVARSPSAAVCPECRTPLRTEDLRQPTRILRQQLARFQVACAHPGCTWKGQRGDFDGHRHPGQERVAPPILSPGSEEVEERPRTADSIPCDTWDIDGGGSEQLELSGHSAVEC
eukprot:Hpha_TRINITY_DN3564_c0_g1::TRINITY_DN3564_c0_g1_i1::g.25761::m.25761